MLTITDQRIMRMQFIDLIEADSSLNNLIQAV